MTEEFSPELLKAKRKAAGMSQRRLSILTKVASTTISDFEIGRRAPKAATWARLLQGLRGEAVKGESKRDTWRKVDAIKPTPPSFSFEAGHVYSIRDHKFGGAYADGINPQYGTLCEFKYEGKRGIHHYFREKKGGWTRTFTDAQLIGKKIEEAIE